MFANVIIVDTEEHKKYWTSWFLVDKNKIHTVYLGVNDKLLHPIRYTDSQEGKKKNKILVHFHGKYIPLQGVPKIIEAANLCKENKRIHFRLIGSGQDSYKVEKLVSKFKLTNIEFIGRVPLTRLNEYMAEADIVLGIFGNTSKAERVIPNKVYEGLMAGKAVITMGTPAIKEIFSEDEIYMVKGDPRSMARAIMKLTENENLRREFAEKGYKRVMNYTPVFVAKSLTNVLKTLSK